MLEKEFDNGEWGKSGWSHEDLSNQPIECDWDDEGGKVEGKFSFLVTTKPTGLQSIEVTRDQRNPFDPSEGTNERIAIPSRLFPEIKRHPSGNGFLLSNKERRP